MNQKLFIFLIYHIIDLNSITIIINLHTGVSTMPLKNGNSKAAIAHNIKQLRKDGYPEKQAIAIAESHAKKTSNSKHSLTSGSKESVGLHNTEDIEVSIVSKNSKVIED